MLSDNFLAVPIRLVRVQEVSEVVLLLSLWNWLVGRACLDVVGGWSEIKHLISQERFASFAQVTSDFRGICSSVSHPLRRRCKLRFGTVHTYFHFSFADFMKSRGKGSSRSSVVAVRDGWRDIIARRDQVLESSIESATEITISVRLSCDFRRMLPLPSSESSLSESTRKPYVQRYQRYM